MQQARQSFAQVNWVQTCDAIGTKREKQDGC